MHLSFRRPSSFGRPVIRQFAVLRGSDTSGFEGRRKSHLFLQCCFLFNHCRCTKSTCPFSPSAQMSLSESRVLSESYPSSQSHFALQALHSHLDGGFLVSQRLHTHCFFLCVAALVPPRATVDVDVKFRQSFQHHLYVSLSLPNWTVVGRPKKKTATRVNAHKLSETQLPLDEA